MAESRQQLIKGSSFLRNEKEKIGGLNVKRSTITGAAFKQGTSQEVAEKIDKRVGNNERKITLLKNIIKGRKENVDKKLGGGGLQSILASIATSVDSIRDTLIQRQESGEEGSDRKRIKAEQEEFDEREKGLEKKKRFEGLKKVGSRVLKPVMSLWERIWNFIKTLFLGKILLNFLSWITNPANQKKVGSFIRFVKDWWPALLGAVLIFGTGFGAMITNLTVAISLWIPKMLGAISALGAIALAGGRGAIGLGRGAIGFGRKAVSAFGATRRFNEGGLVPQPLQGYEGGAMAQGTDTVPAMLTPGEFVMSKGAVNKWGADTLASMNAMGGGTNRPKTLGGRTYAQGGGQVGGKTKTHPLLEKMSDKNIKLVSSDEGYCVTGTLNTMRASGVPDPDYTGQDVGNNPRGAIVQMIKDFGWQSMGGSPITLNSPYGTVNTGVYSRSEYAALVKEGKVPSGALVFQTRHDSWNGTNYKSRGYDMAIAQRKGQGLWNGIGYNRPFIYGSDTKHVIVLTPDGKFGDGLKPDSKIQDSDPSAKPVASGQWWNPLTWMGSPAHASGSGSSSSSTTPKSSAVLSSDQKIKSADGISKPSGGATSSVQVINAAQSQQADAQGSQSSGGDEIPAFEVGTTRDLAKVRTLGIMVM